MAASALNAVVRFLLEPACAACDVMLRSPLESPVCEACWRAVHGLAPPWCPRCGDSVPSLADEDAPLCARCRLNPPSFALARSAGRYDGSLRRIVHAFKYRGCRPLAVPLAQLMRQAAPEVLAGADAAVPVPLHPWRAMTRGFNQADDLARRLGLPVWPALRRRRHGPPQVSLPASRRHANVAAAFDLRGRSLIVGPHWRARLRGRVIVLVDDVMTTGATLDACSRVLLANGVRSVKAVTVARAVVEPRSRHPPPPNPATVPHR